MSDTTATADLYDQFEESLQVLAPGFNNYGGNTEFSGKIQTLKVFEDNTLVREQLASPGNGRVLVVDGGASTRCALLGDNLVTLGIDNGWAGIVINGAVRDSAVVAKMPFGIKALATNPRKSVKRGEGQLDIVLRFGGCVFNNGDILYADNDGIVIKQD